MTESNGTERNGTLRRRFLQATAATGAAIGIGSAAVQAQDEDADIVLGGRTSGWIGQEPEEIDGERNPTLELEAGEEYVLVWENEDGAGHNFIIEDEDGEEEFVASDVVSGTGEMQTIEFTAEEGMAEYFCGPHPQSMRGGIEFVDDEPDEEAEEDEEADEEEPVEEFAAIVDELYEFTLDDEGWHLEGPEELAEDEANPTLELQEGNAYVVTWTNELDEDDMEDDPADADDENDDTNAEEEVDEDNGDDTDDADDTDDSTTELVLLAEDDQEFLRSDETAPGESSAVTFAAPAELEAYRDEATGAEGEIEVEPGEDVDPDDEDENGVEDLFVDPPEDDEADENGETGDEDEDDE